jgi:hypothetical protein
MSAESNKNQIIVAILTFAGVVVTGVSSNWDKLFPRASPPYTFFLLNGDIELNRNRQLFI